MALTPDQKRKLKIEFLANYFGHCGQDYKHAFFKTRKENPSIRMPSKSTLHRWIQDHKHESPHIDDTPVRGMVEVNSPVIEQQETQLQRDFLHMSVLELKDYFRDSILQTIVHQNKANTLMAMVLDSLEIDVKRLLPSMAEDDKLKLLVAIGKAVKPFSDANKTYLEMLEKLKIKRKDLQTIEKQEKKERLEVTIRSTNNENETIGDSEDDS